MRETQSLTVGSFTITARSALALAHASTITEMLTAKSVESITLPVTWDINVHAKRGVGEEGGAEEEERGTMIALSCNFKVNCCFERPNPFAHKVFLKEDYGMNANGRIFE